MAEEGRYSIIVRLLLTAEQRGRLFELCHRQQIDVVDALTNIIGDYLDRRDDLSPPSDNSASQAELQREATRRQLRQLRAQASRLGSDAPPWLNSYIADLEEDVRRER